MVGCFGQSRPIQDSDLVARGVGAVAVAALAVIHVVDLPGTLGPTPLVGVGYLGIILLAAGWGGWQARVHAATVPHRPGALRVVPRRTGSPAAQDRPLRPVR
jgi:hypothetical protein